MLNAGNGILTAPAAWQFDEDVAQNFDQHVRASVPCYDMVQSMVAAISDWFACPGTRVYDLGCATGETMVTIGRRHPARKLRLIGLDESQPMLSRASDKLGESMADLPNTTWELINGSLLDLKAGDISEASMVLSLYTLQFVPLHRRLEVLTSIRTGIIEGGAFVLIEKELAPDAYSQVIWDGIYDDLKMTNGLSAEQRQAKTASLRGVLRPALGTQNRSLLAGAGFRHVDLFFRWFSFSAYLAVV